MTPPERGQPTPFARAPPRLTVGPHRPLRPITQRPTPFLSHQRRAHPTPTFRQQILCHQLISKTALNSFQKPSRRTDTPLGQYRTIQTHGLYNSSK